MSTKLKAKHNPQHTGDVQKKMAVQALLPIRLLSVHFAAASLLPGKRNSFLTCLLVLSGM